MSGRGVIGFFGLDDWWDYELTHHERDELRRSYRPLGGGGSMPDEDDVVSLTGIDGKPLTSIFILNSLLNFCTDYPLQKKLILKGEDLSLTCSKPLDVHFFFGSVIKIEFKNRNNEGGSIDRVVNACRSQIAISSKAKSRLLKLPHMHGELPSHQGYDRLTSIFEGEKKFKESNALCKKALSQGWRGDWQGMIERNTAKIKK